MSSSGEIRQQVTSSLYLGDINAATSSDLVNGGFTHIVSVVDFDVSVDGEVKQHVVNILDQDDANLLDSLEDAVDFIEEAIDDDGKVLVHCVSGVSRSAAVVVAFMCHSMGLTVGEALETLKMSSPQVDEDNEAYKRFKLIQRAAEWEETGQYVDSDRLAEPQEPASSESGSSPPQGPKFRCRKCRTLLVTSRNIITVPDDTGGVASFSFRRRTQAAGRTALTAESGSLFVEPMRWMAGIHAPSGKLYCPRCQAKIGHWCWHGMQAPNGVWVTPAFALSRSKLEEWRPYPLVSAGPQPLQGNALPAQAPVPNASSPSSSSAQPSMAVSPTGEDAPLPSARQATSSAPPQQRQDAGEASPAPSRPCRSAWFTHVVFDCDGVLVDSERASCEALRRAVLEVTGVSVPGKFPEDYYPVIGMSVKSCVEYYNRAHGPGTWNVEGVAQRVAAVKEGHYQELTSGGIAAMQGVQALVKELESLGVQFGIASSGSPEKINHNLSAAGLLQLFRPDLIVSAHDVACGKPAPDVYLEALRRLGCADARRSLVIEDSAHGLQAARAAGAFAVGITNTLPAAALSPLADVVIASLLELDLGALTR